MVCLFVLCFAFCRLFLFFSASYVIPTPNQLASQENHFSEVKSMVKTRASSDTRTLLGIAQLVVCFASLEHIRLSG